MNTVKMAIENHLEPSPVTQKVKGAADDHPATLRRENAIHGARATRQEESSGDESGTEDVNVEEEKVEHGRKYVATSPMKLKKELITPQRKSEKVCVFVLHEFVQRASPALRAGLLKRYVVYLQ